jgi:5-methylcytosine-specific restriction protein A
MAFSALPTQRRLNPSPDLSGTDAPCQLDLQGDAPHVRELSRSVGVHRTAMRRQGVVYPFCVEGVPTGGHGGGLAEYRGMQVYLCPGCGGQSPTCGRCTTCRRSDHRAQALEPERRARNRQAWRDARALTKRRDNYQCVECGRRDELEVHHVVSLRNGGDEYNLDNLVTLCRTHHRFLRRRQKHPAPAFREKSERKTRR